MTAHRTGGRLWEIKGANIISTPRRATSEFRRQCEGTIIALRDNGRDAIDRSYDAPWDPLNLAYFNGYAMWTYHATPFVFAEPGYEAREIEPIEHEGEVLRGLTVRFPDGIHSHTRDSDFTSARTACCDATTTKWTCGRTRRPRTSCRNTST